MKGPKVSINLVNKNGRVSRLTDSAERIKKRTQGSLIQKVKLGQFRSLRIHVNYGRGVTNEMVIKDYEDLKWAFDSFLDRSIYL